MKAQTLPYNIFLETFKYAPRAAISLLIQDKKGKILFTKRKDRPFKDFWHLPGSFIRKGERITLCIKRIGQKELGVYLQPEEFELVGIFDDIDADPRGHVLDIIYKCRRGEISDLKPVGNIKEVRFFPKLPDKIGFNHKETLKKLGYK